MFFTIVICLQVHMMLLSRRQIDKYQNTYLDLYIAFAAVHSSECLNRLMLAIVHSDLTHILNLSYLLILLLES